MNGGLYGGIDADVFGKKASHDCSKEEGAGSGKEVFVEMKIDLKAAGEGDRTTTRGAANNGFGFY